jgi:hypothetical protein
VEDVSTALGERRRAFGVFVDEMQDLDAETMGALIAAQHAANQRDWPFYIMAGLPNLPQVLTETRFYAERLFNYCQIGKISREDAEQALREPAERLGAEYAPNALEILLDAAGGYPYFIQEYGQAAWNLATDRLVTDADATAAVQYGTEQLDAGFFRSRWQRATRSERRMLHAMAADGEGPSPHIPRRPAHGNPAQQPRPLPSRTHHQGPGARNRARTGRVHRPRHGRLRRPTPRRTRHQPRRLTHTTIHV